MGEESMSYELDGAELGHQTNLGVSSVSTFNIMSALYCIRYILFHEYVVYCH